jgi:chemotaxis protein MotB
MITLLMAFFIMLFSMSQVDKAKFAAMLVSVQHQLGAAAAASLSAKVDLAPNGAATAGIADGFAPVVSQMVQREIQDLAVADLVSSEETEAGVVFHLQVGGVLFSPGSADLTLDMTTLLRRMARALAKIPNDVHVEGHTCDLPVHNAQFSDNWELSAARAVNVVLYFIRACDLQPQRFLAAGLADTHPLFPNTSEENRRCNRRIDVIVIRGQPMTGKAETAIGGIAPALDQLVRGR